MSKAILVHETGGPDALNWESVKLPELQDGQVLIRHTAIGFNMIDTYFRKGLYPIKLPFIPGGEAAGIIEETCGDTGDLETGQHVCYLSSTAELGTYCEKNVVNAGRLVAIPDDISDEIAAAALLKGLTAWALLRKVFPVSPDISILVYAAAGGVGSILCQWARHLGARVIGVVGSEKKIDAARKFRCHVVIVRGRDNVVEKVRDLTGGRGVQVVYDSLGKDTFDTSLDCLAKLGMMVSYGNATGPVGPVDLLTLMRKGSLFLTRPQLFHYIEERELLMQAAAELFGIIRAGVVTVEVNQRFALKDAAEAHRVVESKMTTGSTILIP